MSVAAAASAAKEKVSKFFSTTKKGEIHDLKEELANPREDKKVEAVKKVIAAMTEGKDVSMLFTDVLNCMQTHNLELKKLVYLYVMNYAKSQPDRAILAVNTFHKDAQDPNPLVRALAIRTMGCIRVPQITEYLAQPLQLCLKDADPYVRKTAAVAVAKLYDINAEVVVQQGFLDGLRELLADSNPMVVSNAVAALGEIADQASAGPRGQAAGDEIFKVDGAILSKLLAALNECTEWGQVFILDSLAKYTPRDTRDAEAICERVSIRFNHSNSAVVLSSVKVVLLMLPVITNQELVQNYVKKLTPPLITLLSSGKEPEIQYVALRNINLVVQRQSDVLQGDIKMLFCKYNDPIYVKMEKLELMIMLANDKNIDTVLSEFKEYATMVDVEFVRKSVRAIGRCAIKLEAAAERCIKVLLELIQTKVNYVVQEAVIVIKDIFRKYPNRYESIIGTLCENLETLDEPEAKASMVWIIGEYADRIENAAELLNRFLEGFNDESSQVQLQLLTAVVKLFLKKPKDTQEMVQRVLNKATTEADNPDLRDRGFMYWRLLSADPEAAKGVVLGERPLIKDTAAALDDDLLQLLIANIGTLASVFHKPPSAFVSRVRAADAQQSRGLGHDLDEDQDEATPTAPAESPMAASNAPAVKPAAGNILDLDFLGGGAPTAAPVAAANQSHMDALASLGLGSMTTTAAPVAAPVSSNPMDLLAGFGAPSAVAPVAAQSTMMPSVVQATVPAIPPPPKTILLAAEKGAGMELRGAFVKQNNSLLMDLTITNRSAAPLSGFAMQFNRNSFQLAPPSQLTQFSTIQPGQSADGLVPVPPQGALAPPPASTTIQIAMKNSTGQIFYFTAQLSPYLIFTPGVPMERGAYMEAWKAIPDATEHKINVQFSKASPTNAPAVLAAGCVYETAKNGANVTYFSSKTWNGTVILFELTLGAQLGGFMGAAPAQLVTRCSEPTLIPIAEQAIAFLL